MTQNVFEVRVFDCGIQVEAPSPEIFAILSQHVFPSLRRTEKASEHPDLLLRLTEAADQFHLQANGLPIASTTDAVALLPDIIHTMDDAIVQRLASVRAVHAGVIAWSGRVLLLPGPTHSGKSSLVAELLKRGATYFSDEYALIDSSGLVHPYPRPLLLRNEFSEQQLPALPATWNAPTGDAPAPIGWILALEYQPSYTWDLTPISQSEALLLLLKNTPHVLAESPDLAEICRRAVAGATCYVGRRPDAPHAVDHILQLLTRPS